MDNKRFALPDNFECSSDPWNWYMKAGQDGLVWMFMRRASSLDCYAMTPDSARELAVALNSFADLAVVATQP